MRPPADRILAAVAAAVLVALCCAAGYGLGLGVAPSTSSRMFPWIVARATGIGAFLALTGLVVMGILFRRPVRATSRVQRETLLRFHVGLWPALCGLVAAHIGALLADRYAGVGWKALAVPNTATYRPGAVTYGLIALYLLLVLLASALLAGRFPVGARWAPLHRLAYPAFVLVWVHGVLAGSDTTALRWLYALTAVVVGAGAVATALRRPLGDGAGVAG